MGAAQNEDRRGLDDLRDGVGAVVPVLDPGELAAVQIAAKDLR